MLQNAWISLLSVSNFSCRQIVGTIREGIKMNIRDEWNALGKLIGFALQTALFIGAFFGFIALMEMAGL